MESLKWFLNWLQGFYRRTYPLSTLGTRLILAGSIAGLPLTVLLQANIENSIVIPFVELQTNAPSFLSGLISLMTVFSGCYMISHELRSSARKTARVFIAGLPNMSPDFPHGLMTRTEERKAREAVTFWIEADDEEDIEKSIKKFNAELSARVFQRFVLHNHCEKVYIGGLARIPFLVVYGSIFRTEKAQTIYFDKLHDDGIWRLLNEENENINVVQTTENITANKDGDIGLAIAFSTPFSESCLPPELQGHTLILHPNVNTNRNLIRNQENLHAISIEITKIIDNVSAQSSGRIHLFLSVQSTLAIEIGRRFQEGIHRPWVVHNFDASNNQYNWAIELTKNGANRY
tara:strand:- start:1192 stop:2232 length:1041 start_codon:yes stop_codon:yes gene_type:complete